MKQLTCLLGVGLFLFATGCKKKADEETVSDLCAEQCALSAEACPPDSFGAQTEELCSFLCIAYKDSDSCYDKFEDYMSCLANHEPICDVFETPTGCEDAYAPFVIDGTDAAMHGECVREDVTVE